MPEKPLENFNFYRNIGNSVTVEQIVEEYNNEYPGKPITVEDVKFGPDFHDCGQAYPELCLTGFHFDYYKSGYFMRKVTCYRDIEFPKGVFIYSEEPKRENLAEVLGIIEDEEYLDRFAIKCSSSNDYESFGVSGSKLVSIIESVAKTNGWQFKQTKRDTSYAPNYSEPYGYLTVDDVTYQLRESPRGLTCFDKHGEKIKSGEGEIEIVMGIMGKIEKPVRDKLKSEENEWLTECCGGEYPDPDP